MSHHYSGPDFGFPHGDARLDLTDLYAFPKPGEPDKSILIMNVHPSAGLNPPGPTTADPFASDAIYELKIDTDGDAIADIAYRVRFSHPNGGTQTATLRRVEGTEAAGAGDGGQLVLEGAPVSTGREARVTAAGDYRFFAGWRSEPFFFDTQGALNDLQFTGTDFFAGADVCSIVLEVANAVLGSKQLGLWHRTLDGASGKWVQADRGRGPRKPSSSAASKMVSTWLASRWTTPVSSLYLPTRWNIRAATRQMRRGASRRLCCRTSSPMIPGALHPIPTTAGRSLTMSLMSSSRSSQMGR